jgi:hypothetical protein
MTHKIGTQIPSSTGGVITITARGLIHTAGGTYSGKIAQAEDKSKKD